MRERIVRALKTGLRDSAADRRPLLCQPLLRRETPATLVRHRQLRGAHARRWPGRSLQASAALIRREVAARPDLTLSKLCEPVAAQGVPVVSPKTMLKFINESAVAGPRRARISEGVPQNRGENVTTPAAPYR